MVSFQALVHTHLSAFPWAFGWHRVSGVGFWSGSVSTGSVEAHIHIFSAVAISNFFVYFEFK